MKILTGIYSSRGTWLFFKHGIPRLGDNEDPFCLQANLPACSPRYLFNTERQAQGSCEYQLFLIILVRFDEESKPCFPTTRRTFYPLDRAPIYV